MKPAWRRQPKKLVIESARKPQEGQPLSGVVQVIDTFGRGVSYIKFPTTTVGSLAKRMPRGIGPAEPAYLRVVNKFPNFEVWCCYLHAPDRRLLWVEETLPEWIGYIQRPIVP